jgi:L-aspartate oxidase
MEMINLIYKRYVQNFDTKKDDAVIFDVVIIGTGIAGMYTALNIDKRLKVAMITKKTMQISNTAMAQGGIAAPIGNDDSPEIHYMDTIKAGSGLCNSKMAKILVSEALINIDMLIKMGVPFDLDDKNKIALGQEGGHIKKRILHAGGDATGRIILEQLGAKLKLAENITIFENTFLVDIITIGHTAVGVLLKQKEKKFILFSKYIVLASGGYGYIYKYTTNPEITTGDGCAAAIRCGAKVVDMEFVQFHPTVLFHPMNNSFLISEAVRGEGGILYNSKGERFMPNYHPLAELAPRDIVARSIFFEMQKANSKNVFLDVTHLDKEFIKRRFPNIYSNCIKIGLDITRERIPVAPAQHYSMGGVLSDENGKTSVENLFVCGEAAGTMVHGANRLASNSLLEGLVFGRRIAQFINNHQVGSLKIISIGYKEECENHNLNIISEIELFREKMSSQAGIIRINGDLRNLLDFIINRIDYLKNKKLQNLKEIEFYNMLTVGYTIVQAALMREESRGSHYRYDFPQQDDINWKKHLIFSLNGWEVIDENA